MVRVLYNKALVCAVVYQNAAYGQTVAIVKISTRISLAEPTIGKCRVIDAYETARQNTSIKKPVCEI